MHEEYNYEAYVEGNDEVEELWDRDLSDRIQQNLWKIDQFLEPQTHADTQKKNDEEQKRLKKEAQIERDQEARKERVLKSAHELKLKVWDPKDKEWGDRLPRVRQQPVSQQEEDDASRVEQFLASQEGQTWAATYKWTGPDATKLLEEKAATWETKWVAENKYAEEVTSANQQLVAAGGSMISWMKGRGLEIPPEWEEHFDPSRAPNSPLFDRRSRRRTPMPSGSEGSSSGRPAGSSSGGKRVPQQLAGRLPPGTASTHPVPRPVEESQEVEDADSDA